MAFMSDVCVYAFTASPFVLFFGHQCGSRVPRNHIPLGFCSIYDLYSHSQWLFERVDPSSRGAFVVWLYVDNVYKCIYSCKTHRNMSLIFHVQVFEHSLWSMVACLQGLMPVFCLCGVTYLLGILLCALAFCIGHCLIFWYDASLLLNINGYDVNVWRYMERFILRW